MAINTYAELKTSIANYLHRSDLTSVIPNFIALAESDINADIADLPELLARATATTAAGNPLVDTVGMYAIRDAWMDGLPLAILQPGAIPSSTGATDEPEALCIEGTTSLRIFPTPDGAYSIDVLYIPVISPSLAGGEPDATATNWILQQHPGCYLYGSLLQASAFIQDDGRMAMWQTAYDAAIGRLRSANRAGHTKASANAVMRLNGNVGGI